MLSLASIAQPLNYYSSAYGLTGTDLKTALHDIIDDHTELEYGTIKTVIRQADQDPNNPNNIILLYTGNSISKWDFASDPSNPDHNDFWNREHVGQSLTETLVLTEFIQIVEQTQMRTIFVRQTRQ